MGIFQTTVLRNYRKGLDMKRLNEAWEIFKNHFHNPDIQENIRNSKEEQYQEGFLDDLLVKVFGYVKNPEPDFNLTTKLKNIRGAKKTDGAILKNGKALAVIELKGTDTTDLGKVETQAFGYKNNQPDCQYVITSNFEKLRFYVENAVNFEEFNLFQLKKEEFEVLWLCLSAKNLLRNVPLKIKADSVAEDEKVTQKLYAHYAQFRSEMFEDIVKRNAQHDKLTLFKKTQKLLDRFLFLYFAEDRGLLPPNSVRKILRDWTDLREKYDVIMPLYDRFKQYFEYMNTGKKEEIYPYNGGLFAPDDLLDSIKIDDGVLYKHAYQLGRYDYESEVSINILGHIFEHSLNEIEEIQAKLQNISFNKSKTKRKKDGVFYTPQYITKYMVENTIGKLCEEKKTELAIIEEEYEKGRKRRQKTTLKKLQNKLQTYRDWLLELTICDPACGSGAFLNQALEFLQAEHRYIDELNAKLLDIPLVMSDIDNTILENNLFGVDINEESVEIAQLSLWLHTARKGRKLTTLTENIKCGNSLIDDPEVACEKAFEWQKEFPHIFEKGGFDVVIGNPPYGVNFNDTQKHYLSNFDSLVSDYEIYIYFISLYRKILRQSGLLSYIFPNTFLSTIFGQKYRHHLFENVSVYHLTDLSEDKTFHDASVRTCILSFKNIESDYVTQLSRIQENKLKLLKKYSKQELLKNTLNLLSLFSQTQSEQKLISKIKKNPILADFHEVSQGLIPYDKYRGHDEKTIKNRIWHADNQKDDTYRKELKGADVQRYYTQWNGNLWISYGDWLAAPRDKKFFTVPRLLVREITNGYLFCNYVEDEYYNTPSLINIIDEKQILALKYTLTLLNSKLLGWYHNQTSPKAKKGLFPKILVNDVRKLPIKNILTEEQQSFIKKSNRMLSLNSDFQAEKSNFLKTLQEEKGIEKISKKLDAFYELEYDEFKKELRKKKVKISLGSENNEWREYFNTTRKKAQDLQSEIRKTDAEIDQMVYELYGLTEEEIAIVEAS